MTIFPNSPRLLKGALVTIDLQTRQPQVILFQYNPETLSRSLQAQVMGGESGRPGPLRFSGAPSETISLEIEIDAADKMEQGDPVAGAMGIYPQLAALEILLYPPSSQVLLNQGLMEAGVLEIVPPEAPLTLFIYGPQRVLPVHVTDFHVTEELHDPRLNPLRAKISLGLSVLSYNDLLPGHPGFSLYMIHQAAKEAMARLYVVSSLAASGAPSLK
jgi:hypothetical protein